MGENATFLSFVLFHPVICKGFFMKCSVADNPEKIPKSCAYDTWCRLHSNVFLSITNMNSTCTFYGLQCECTFLSRWFQAGAQQVDLAGQHVSSFAPHWPLLRHRLQGLLVLFRLCPCILCHTSCLQTVCKDDISTKRGWAGLVGIIKRNGVVKKRLFLNGIGLRTSFCFFRLCP